MKSIFLFILLSTVVFAQKSVRPWIGVMIETHEKGVYIKGAMDNTPASRAGFLKGDIIVSVDGIAVKTPQELIDLVGKKGVGNDVKIHYFNIKKQHKETTLKLEAMPGLTKIAEKKLLNKKSPDVNGKDLSKPKSKTEYSLASDGKVKIIEFWATWCGACMQAHPLMDKFAKENKKDITVVSISSEAPIKIKKYLKQAKKHKVLSGNVVFVNDETGKINGEFYVPVLPMFFVVDKKNTIRLISVGAGRNLFNAFNLALKLTNQ